MSQEDFGEFRGQATQGPGAELFLPLQLVLGYGLACACFLVGIPLGGWQFWLSAAVTIALAFGRSRRIGLQTLALNVLMIVLTAYTFTYIHCDASSCHVPMSRFFEEGWNPIREATLEPLYAHYAQHGITAAEDPRLNYHALHVLIDPKFAQILAAQLQAACRFFTAAGYPLWFLLMALAMTAWRTARDVFGAPRWARALLTTLLCCNSELTYGSLRGQVDYVTYAAVVLAGLSLLNWCNGRRRGDLVVFFASLVIASVSKFNGLCTALLYLGLAVVIGRKNRDLWIGLAVFLGSMALFGLLPYWTAAWWYGSPLYPAHTFRPDVPLPDLTNDFIGLNPAARQMGYLARMVYAYVSPDLALWGCRWWYHDPDFAPVWQYDWITSGWDAARCLWVWSGLAVTFLACRRAVKAVLAVLFLSFFLLPVKYIGFPRYVAQVHAAIALAWFAFACRTSGKVRYVIFAGYAVITGIYAYVSLAHFVQQLNIEAAVQRNLATIRSSPTPYSFCVPLEANDCKLEDRSYQETWSYIIRDRFAAAGQDIVINGPGEPLMVGWHMILQGKDLEQKADRFPRPVFK